MFLSFPDAGPTAWMLPGSTAVTQAGSSLTRWITPESGPSAPFFPPACHDPGSGKQSFQLPQAVGRPDPQDPSPWQAISHLWQQQGHLPPLQRDQPSATYVWMLGKGPNL